MFDEDMIRLLESRFDVQAVKDPSKLTDKPVYQAAVAESRDELAGARADLVGAVAHNSRARGETDAEGARAQTLIGKAQDHYRYYRGRAKDALLNPPPNQPLSAEEIHRRQRLFDRYYGLPPYDLERLALDKKVEVFEHLLTAYQSEKDLKNLGHLPALKAVFDPAIEAGAEFQREVGEDLGATQALKDSRAAFDRAHRAHIRQVDSVLTRFGREDEARHFIKRRDPAYAARRRAKAPAAQEPDIDRIESETHGEQPATV